jgi:glycosyltransferase involved in cell wall biosynthesis
MQPLVTIAVCTKNRPEGLARCLSSISKLNYEEKEVVVVDSSSQSTVKNVRSLVEAYDYDYIYESKPGLSIARNDSILNSHGNFVAFTDDDCFVDENWAVRLIENFSCARVMCVTGRVVPARGGNSMFERFLNPSKGRQKRAFSIRRSPLKLSSLLRLGTETKPLGEQGPIPWCIGTGNNMAFRKAVFKSVGLFDEKIGVGTPQRGGEDMDMFLRIFSHGFELVYDPNAIVYHSHNHERSLEAMADTYFSYGRGAGCFMVKHINNRYICMQYFGRILNLQYALLRCILENDTVSSYLRRKQLQGMISSISYAFRR